MNSDELFEIGEKLYHDGSKVQEAIIAFKELVNSFPKHANGWQYLSTMYYENAEFDKWLNAIDTAILIEPNNIWFKEIRLTSLSLLAKFSYQKPNFFKDVTKEYYAITSFQDEKEIQLELLKSIEELLELNRDNPKKVYDYNMKLGHLKRKLQRFEDAINHFSFALKNIPSSYPEQRKERTIRNIEKLILATNSEEG